MNPASNTPSVRYSTVVADPPWAYDGGDALPFPPGLKKNGNQQASVGPRDSYQRMTTDELLALRPPVADNAHLYLWTTNAFMVEAHEIARAWGFTPKTICTWTKTYQDDPTRVSMKTGYYFRGATEHWIFAVRGSLRLQTSQGLPTAYLWPRLPHSVKPDAFYDLVELASPGPYLEMFSRRARFGWDYWGDQSLGTADFDTGSPCGVCRSYGHFTHNHPEGYVNPMYDYLGIDGRREVETDLSAIPEPDWDEACERYVQETQ